MNISLWINELTRRIKCLTEENVSRPVVFHFSEVFIGSEQQQKKSLNQRLCFCVKIQQSLSIMEDKKKKLHFWKVLKKKQWRMGEYCANTFFLILCNKFARLKNKIENNSTWEGAFYQSEWVKISSSYFHYFI